MVKVSHNGQSLKFLMAVCGQTVSNARIEEIKRLLTDRANKRGLYLGEW